MKKFWILLVALLLFASPALGADCANSAYLCSEMETQRDWVQSAIDTGVDTNFVAGLWPYKSPVGTGIHELDDNTGPIYALTTAETSGYLITTDGITVDATIDVFQIPPAHDGGNFAGVIIDIDEITWQFCDNSANDHADCAASDVTTYLNGTAGSNASMTNAAFTVGNVMHCASYVNGTTWNWYCETRYGEFAFD